MMIRSPGRQAPARTSVLSAREPGSRWISKQASRALANAAMEPGSSSKGSARITTLSKAWVTDMLVENVQRAMQATPVKNKKGIPL